MPRRCWLADRCFLATLAGASLATPSGARVSVEVEASGAPRSGPHEENVVQLHPRYPQMPLALAGEYKYGPPINLEYPGLQLVHRSPSGAPLFLINDFLNATECDMLIAKLSFERRHSVAYDQNERGVDKVTRRSSTHVRVAKTETTGLHNRIAELTRRARANMESVSKSSPVRTTACVPLQHSQRLQGLTRPLCMHRPRSFTTRQGKSSRVTLTFRIRQATSQDSRRLMEGPSSALNLTLKTPAAWEHSADLPTSGA